MRALRSCAVRSFGCCAKDFVLHVDTTYKLNQSGYPVFVVGVSDPARSFHPVALFVMSQQTGELIGSALSSVFEQIKQVTMSYPEVLFRMGDADKAQYNAVSTPTSTKTGNRKCAVCLMCFFHVVKNVANRVSKLPLEAVSLVFKHLYQMHYARNATEFASEAEIALSAWTTRADLKTFGPYFKKQWIDSVFWRWACYHTPHGYAKTNNPVEQFNNAIKRDYSLRTLLKLVALTDQLTLICRHRSRGTTTFALGPKPNRELQDRDKYLAKNGRLSVIQPHKHGLDFLRDEPSETHIANVYQRGAPPRQPEVDASKKKKKMGKRNKHRMEIWQQPVDGWRVDMQSNVCPCHSWYKYRLCVHLLAALKATGRAIPGVTPAKIRFVNRRRKRKGRNADVGPALALE